MQRMIRQRTAAGIAHARCLPCMRTRFCSFLPHFARESGSMFLAWARGRAAGPLSLFCAEHRRAGWLALLLLWPGLPVRRRPARAL